MARLLRRLLKNAFAWLISIIVLIPFAVMLVNSLKTKEESYSMTLKLPAVMQLQNYLTVIEQGNIIASFFNSFMYATICVVLVVLTCSMAAFVISRNETGFNKFVYLLIITGIVLPVNYVALMKVMQVTLLNDTRLGISLLYAAMNIPISLFISTGFIHSIPRELDEAAIIDGCGPWNLFFRVIFPLLKPIAVTVGVLAFMAAWNDFMMPLYYLNTSEKWPMSLSVYSFFGASMQAQRQWNLVCADIVLTSVPVIVVYLLGQRYIVSGITAGAVKG
ncbi:MAG TPA: ABC transporter permease [Firmicutes bacterium]|jgi:raffinose/stachyose/melibiose transport system permease protein|nr:ABC transporter permease [Bacillota bacterium]